MTPAGHDPFDSHPGEQPWRGMRTKYKKKDGSLYDCIIATPLSASPDGKWVNVAAWYFDPEQDGPYAERRGVWMYHVPEGIVYWHPCGGPPWP